MKSAAVHRLFIAVLFTFALLLPAALPIFSPAAAGDGRDFEVFYELGEPLDLGGTFRVTLVIRMFNFSGGDVRNAVVTLQKPLPAVEDYGAFPIVALLANEESLKVSAEFMIPAEEHARLVEGGRPSLRIDFTGDSGLPQRRTIDATALAVGE